MISKNCSLPNILDRNLVKFVNVSSFSTERCPVPKSEVKSGEKDVGQSCATTQNVAPYSAIPGPNKYTFIGSFLPGGKFYNKHMIYLFSELRKEFGNLYVLKGAFGKHDRLVTLDPNHFETIFRTEGVWPSRPGLECLTHYRQKMRKDVYGNTDGLMEEHGEVWTKLRTIANPLLMQPKSTKLYFNHNKIVADNFIQRIRKTRHSDTNEVSDDFGVDIRKWALDAIALVSLNTHLNLLNSDNVSSDANRIFEAFVRFFELLNELEIKPSMWKIYPTKVFKEMVQVQDTIFEVTMKYINEAIQQINKNDLRTSEESILEKMLEVDKKAAVILAMDLLIGGVDTTFSAFTSCLYHIARNQDKQDILREELMQIMPKKDTELTIENMNNLPYFRACIKEALRIHPVAIAIMRMTGRDIILDGYNIPKGTRVAMISGIVQTDEAQFPKPFDFIPERWLRNNPKAANYPSGKTSHAFAYLPFGFGPRMCIGKRLVEQEIEIILAKIVRNFRVEYNYPELEYKHVSFNIPVGPFKFKFSDI